MPINDLRLCPVCGHSTIFNNDINGNHICIGFEHGLYSPKYQKECVLCGEKMTPFDSSGSKFQVELLGYRFPGIVETYCNKCIVDKLRAYDTLIEAQSTEDKKK